MTFDEWLNEIENHSLRVERLYEDLNDYQGDNIEIVLNWLEAAYNVGREAGYDAGVEAEGYNPI
jgi:hypothetical protein